VTSTRWTPNASALRNTAAPLCGSCRFSMADAQAAEARAQHLVDALAALVEQQRAQAAQVAAGSRSKKSGNGTAAGRPRRELTFPRRFPRKWVKRCACEHSLARDGSRACNLALAVGRRPRRRRQAGARQGGQADKKKGKEVTLKGDLGCGKCNFKTTKECQNVLKVTEDGKDTMYYLADKTRSAREPRGGLLGHQARHRHGHRRRQGQRRRQKKVLTASAIKID